MNYSDKFIVRPKSRIKINEFDPNFSDTDYTKETYYESFNKNINRLKELQEALFAEHKQSILIVLQAIDGGGKDGTIQNVFGPLNSAGCKIASFKVPTPIEADHDFLWRVHKETPAKGEVTVFNRSHYEQVLVVRVHGFEPKELNDQRYEQINNFEKLLSDNNTHIIKFFLNISKTEQLERFKARLDDPSKHWKLSANDYKERQLWVKYHECFEEIFEKCSKDNAPWYIIPSNKKWFRDLAISKILVDFMQNLKIGLPSTSEDIEEIKRLYEIEASKSE